MDPLLAYRLRVGVGAVLICFAGAVLLFLHSPSRTLIATALGLAGTALALAPGSLGSDVTSKPSARAKLVANWLIVGLMAAFVICGIIYVIAR